MSIAAAIPGAGGAVAAQPSRRGKKLTPYFLLLPAGLALIVFYVLPTLTLASTSLQTGTVEQGFTLTWHWANYSDVLTEYWPQFLRSFVYAGVATVFALLIAYPLAYTIAFKAGRYRTLMLALVVAPFFTSFLIRTLAWRQILADEGPVVNFMKATGIMKITDALGMTQGSGAGHRVRGGARPDLQLPAVHDAAAVRLPGEDGSRRCCRRLRTCTRTPGTVSGG